MTEVEDAIVDVHVCPIGTTTLGDAELAHHVELFRSWIDESHEATTFVVDEEFVVSSNDGAFAGTTCPFLLVVCFACFPVDAAPVAVVVGHSIRTIDFAVDKHIAPMVGVEGFCTPHAFHTLEVIS